MLKCLYIHINDNYFLKYVIKFEKKRQIYLYYLASANEDKPNEYQVFLDSY